MGPKPEVPFWDVKYTDLDDKVHVTQVKAHNYLQCTHEFRAIYKGMYKVILGMKQRYNATVPVLEWHTHQSVQPIFLPFQLYPMKANIALSRPDFGAPAKSIIMYTDGSHRVMTHSRDVFVEDKKKGIPSFVEKMHTLAIAWGIASNITTVQGDAVIYSEHFGKPKAQEKEGEIPATVNGLNAKQLRKKHRKEPLETIVKL